MHVCSCTLTLCRRSLLLSVNDLYIHSIRFSIPFRCRETTQFWMALIISISFRHLSTFLHTFHTRSHSTTKCRILAQCGTCCFTPSYIPYIYLHIYHTYMYVCTLHIHMHVLCVRATFSRPAYYNWSIFNFISIKLLLYLTANFIWILLYYFHSSFIFISAHRQFHANKHVKCSLKPFVLIYCCFCCS